MIVSGDAVTLTNVTTATPTTAIKDIQVQLEKEIGSLKNESVQGSFNVPTLEPCKYIKLLCIIIQLLILTLLFIAEETAVKYYNLVFDSDGDDALNLKYVSAIGYIKPIPFGFCEHGPVWAIHYVPGFFFWPPIPKRVCARPCPVFGQRCRASCCETECVYRFVWRCTRRFCRRLRWRQICYDQHNCCKCTCRFSRPYCYL